MRYRGQRVASRKAGQGERRRSESGWISDESAWEEKFNLRSSKESVEAAFEEGDDDEREGSGGWGEQGDEDRDAKSNLKSTDVKLAPHK